MAAVQDPAQLAVPGPVAEPAAGPGRCAPNGVRRRPVPLAGGHGPGTTASPASRSSGADCVAAPILPACGGSCSVASDAVRSRSPGSNSGATDAILEPPTPGNRRPLGRSPPPLPCRARPRDYGRSYCPGAPRPLTHGLPGVPTPATLAEPATQEGTLWVGVRRYRGLEVRGPACPAQVPGAGAPSLACSPSQAATPAASRAAACPRAPSVGPGVRRSSPPASSYATTLTPSPLPVRPSPAPPTSGWGGGWRPGDDDGSEGRTDAPRPFLLPWRRGHRIGLLEGSA